MRHERLTKDEIASKLMGAAEHIRLASNLLDEACRADETAQNLIESIEETGHVSTLLAKSICAVAEQFAEAAE